MFLYDDKDYLTLMDDPEVDLDSPQALYAMAQFCRMGKGIPASEEQYRAYLERAAEAGSEEAKAELQAAAQPARQDEGEKQQFSLAKTLERADAGDLEAILEAAAACRRLEDPQRARRYLENGVALLSQVPHTDEIGQKLCLALADLLEAAPFRDAAGCTRALGMAEELGSGEAARRLVDRYRNGIGCEKDQTKADRYYERSMRYEKPLMRSIKAFNLFSTGGHKMEASLMLEGCYEEVGTEEARRMIEILFAALDLRPLPPQAADWAWGQVTEDGSLTLEASDGENGGIRLRNDTSIFELACRNSLRREDNALELSAEQALRLASWSQNVETRFEWMRYAAQLGDVEAMYQTAIYCLGKNPPYSAGEAVKWYECGVEAGDPRAMIALGQLLYDGAMVKQDRPRGEALMEQAAATGNLEAKYRLAKMRLEGADAAGGEALLEEVAREGAASAQRLLGERLLERGDTEGALRWLKQAADQQNLEAMALLGRMYFEGRGVEQSDQRAAMYLTAPAEQGQLEAQKMLGQLYSRDGGTAENLEAAEKWNTRAAEQGDVDAMERLYHQYMFGRGVERNEQVAVYWLRRAVAGGRERLERSLADCLLRGIGTAPDRAQAHLLYKKAAAHGDAEAQKILNQMAEEDRRVQEEKARAEQQAAQRAHQQRMVRPTAIALDLFLLLLILTIAAPSMLRLSVGILAAFALVPAVILLVAGMLTGNFSPTQPGYFPLLFEEMLGVAKRAAEKIMDKVQQMLNQKSDR